MEPAYVACEIRCSDAQGFAGIVLDVAPTSAPVTTTSITYPFGCDQYAETATTEDMPVDVSIPRSFNDWCIARVNAEIFGPLNQSASSSAVEQWASNLTCTRTLYVPPWFEVVCTCGSSDGNGGTGTQTICPVTVTHSFNQTASIA